MRRNAFILVGVTVLFAGAAAGAFQETSGDTKALDEALEAYQAAFNAHDAKAVAALYTEDADLVLPDGKRLKGRAIIEKALAEQFAQNPKVTGKSALTSRRFIKPDVVAEDGRWEESGYAREGFSPKGLYTFVLVKQGGKWLVVCERAWVPVTEPEASKDSEKK